MCGIFFYRNLGGRYNLHRLYRHFKLLTHRGPDRSHFQELHGSIFGFQRLMVNNLAVEADQPSQRQINGTDLVLICNGEIYNHREINPQHSGSDCEVIFDLYEKYGATSELLESLNGVYSFILVDIARDRLIIGRDLIGVRPLYMFKGTDSIGFASEAKALEGIDIANITAVDAGTIQTYNYSTLVEISRESMKLRSEIQKQSQTSISVPPIQSQRAEGDSLPHSEIEVEDNIRHLLEQAVKKRIENTDRKVGLFLSGGLDSSLIAQIASRHGVKDSFSIGLTDSSDLKSARLVADKLGLNHHEVSFTAAEGWANLQELIWHLESHDITTIRASMPMFLLSKYIRDQTDIRVLLSGEGADELFSGYLYNHYAPSDAELHQEVLKRLAELHYFDVLRADRTTSASGLELRVPFLDKDLITYVLGVPAELRKPRPRIGTGQGRCVEKYLLRKSFDTDMLDLPAEILWRTKEAFSDGVGHSWTSYLQEQSKLLRFKVVAKRPNSKHLKFYQNYPKPALQTSQGISVAPTANESQKSEGDNVFSRSSTPVQREAQVYRDIYNMLFQSDLIPHHWMPNWTSEHGGDPSASRLNIYN